MPAQCFVVMGFGEKSDAATGRVLNLDKTYKNVIKPAVLGAGLECVRADEIQHAGVIDKPMYDLLLGAEMVIADLSTANLNAFYELGVRHALRPHRTIVIAEKEFKYPFDINHIVISPYEHLGKGIEVDEASRMIGVLTDLIKKLMNETQTDSPVYTYLPGLKQPKMTDFDSERSATSASVAPDLTAAALQERFQQARTAGDWRAAKNALELLRLQRPTDPYLLQQLALATYKSKSPDEKSALEAAHVLLATLEPVTTTDPETLGLWGAVHKRLWELAQDRNYLDESIRAYEKGYLLKNDHYNGINLAFLLNCRASVSAPRERIADEVAAERVRRRVVTLCQTLLAKGIRSDDGTPNAYETYWVEATLYEAWVGLGQGETAAAQALAGKLAIAPESWMPETMAAQVAKLRAFMA